MPPFVFLYLLAKRLVLFSALFRVTLLLFEDGCGLSRLMALVDRGAGDCRQHRKDRNQQLRVEQFQHRNSYGK